jgi:hypothetical protein
MPYGMSLLPSKNCLKIRRITALARPITVYVQILRRITYKIQYKYVFFLKIEMP